MCEKDLLLTEAFGISEKTIALATDAEASLTQAFRDAEDTAAYNQLKVLQAFQNHRISYAHFGETSGYGYDDLGRDTLDKVYAEIFGAEDALVRHNISGGTQALAATLYGLLRPGNTMAAICGAPYNTLEEVIGIRGEADSGSLKDFGIAYEQVDLLPDGKPDYEGIRRLLTTQDIKLAEIQRSRGYTFRNAFSIEEIEKVIQLVKEVSPHTICMVDNCYGEFVEKSEPTQVGADVAVGSLIKNIGGGLAPCGGYVVGKKEYVEKISYRMTAPGVGREVGPSLGFNRALYQGLFMAPHIVSESLKTAMLCGTIFHKLGYPVCPLPGEHRSDIIQAIQFGSAEKVIAFCRAIQHGSPIDSHVTAEPWDMPGYGDPVIMAAGAFVQGSSIELSADAPICPPYNAYMQGGVIYQAARVAVLKAADAIGGME